MGEKQWKGKILFSHGTNHSRGVPILVKDRLDFRLQSVKVHSEGLGIKTVRVSHLHGVLVWVLSPTLKFYH